MIATNREITDSKYWNKYWSEINKSDPTYNISKGLFYSYNLLFKKYVTKLTDKTERMRLQVLDCGCGEGLILRYFKENFLNVKAWGIEYSDSIIAANRLANKLGLQFNLIKADLYQGIPDNLVNKCDLVVSVGLIEHFYYPVEILQIMKTAVRPGGCLLTLIPNFSGVYNYFWRLYDYANYEKHIPISEHDLLKYHKHIGLKDNVIYYLGVPTIPGIHEANEKWEKILNKFIVNVNGRILHKIVQKQYRLSTKYPMVPVIACAGWNREEKENSEC